jgi:hypothetical protein
VFRLTDVPLNGFERISFHNYSIPYVLLATICFAMKCQDVFLSPFGLYHSLRHSILSWPPLHRAATHALRRTKSGMHVESPACTQNYSNREFLCLVATLRSRILQSKIVFQHQLPISSLHTTWPFVKQESSDRKRIWLDIATPWRECSSHRHPSARPCHVIRNMLPVLIVDE